MTRALTRGGCGAVAVASGYQLVQHLADAILGARGLRPDLIVLGPGLTGCRDRSMVLGLRDLDWDSRILLLLGEDEETAAREWRECGAQVGHCDRMDVLGACRAIAGALLTLPRSAFSPLPTSPGRAAHE